MATQQPLRTASSCSSVVGSASGSRGLPSFFCGLPLAALCAAPSAASAGASAASACAFGPSAAADGCSEGAAPSVAGASPSAAAGIPSPVQCARKFNKPRAKYAGQDTLCRIGIQLPAVQADAQRATTRRHIRISKRRTRCCGRCSGGRQVRHRHGALGDDALKLVDGRAEGLRAHQGQQRREALLRDPVVARNAAVLLQSRRQSVSARCCIPGKTSSGYSAGTTSCGRVPLATRMSPAKQGTDVSNPPPDISVFSGVRCRGAQGRALTLLSWRSKVLTPVDMTFSWPFRSASSSARTAGATRYTRFGRAASSLRVTCAHDVTLWHTEGCATVCCHSKREGGNEVCALSCSSSRSGDHSPVPWEQEI